MSHTSLWITIAPQKKLYLVKLNHVKLRKDFLEAFDVEGKRARSTGCQKSRRAEAASHLTLLCVAIGAGKATNEK